LHFKGQQHHSFLISFFVEAIPLFKAFSRLADGNYLTFILNLLGWMFLQPAGNFVGVLDFKMIFVFLFI